MIEIGIMRLRIPLILAAVTVAASGCSPARGFLYPCTDHAKCIKRCEEQHRGTYSEVICEDRCDRELGAEMSRDRKFDPPERGSDQRNF